MHFTREPIVETIITPREGHKLVVKSTKSSGGEEFFVDALQVICMGTSIFYRSLEKPRPFVVPAQDFEVLEVRDTKMTLKIPQADEKIKIAGGREAPLKHTKEPTEEITVQEISEPPSHRKKESRRFRKKKRDDVVHPPTEEAPSPELSAEREERMSMLIPPPSTLISETIARYKNIPGFASAFFEKEEAASTTPDDTASEEDEPSFNVRDEPEEQHVPSDDALPDDTL